MLFHPLNEILGSGAKVQILRALLPLTTPVSGREAQRLARVRSRKGGSVALEELSDLGVLQRVELRGSHLYQVNPEHELVRPLATLFGVEEDRLRVFVSTIRTGLAERNVADRVSSLILYGSNARWEAKPRSDVDLLAVVGSELAVVEVRHALLEVGEEVRRRQGLRISPYVLSANRVEERLEKGDPLMETIRKEGRILLGDPLPGMSA